MVLVSLSRDVISESVPIRKFGGSRQLDGGRISNVINELNCVQKFLTGGDYVILVSMVRSNVPRPLSIFMYPM